MINSAIVFVVLCVSLTADGSAICQWHCVEDSPTACRGVADGDYQACSSCENYTSCMGGETWIRRRCPISETTGRRTQWQITSSTQGYCTDGSITCNNCGPPTTTVKPTTASPVCSSTGKHCITSSPSSCNSLPDGDYQSCERCTEYHSCSGGVNWAKRPCPYTNQGGLRGQLVWVQIDSIQGYCDYDSVTCTECSNVPPELITNTPAPIITTAKPPETSCRSTGSNCLTGHSDSCLFRADGDYQACEGCTIYHSCSGGVMWANRFCPLTNQGGLHGRLVWEQRSTTGGICEYSSSTCRECTDGIVTIPGPCTSTGASCISASFSSCVGRGDGDYQACEGCTFYHSCTNERIEANRPCALNTDGRPLVWVTETAGRGHCDYTSSTCRDCASSGTGPIELRTTTRSPAPTTTPDPTWRPCEATGPKCITGYSGSCKGRADGHYQACEGCTIYHSCSGEVMYASRSCPLTNRDGLHGRLVWTQLTPTEGICDYFSGTCTECVNPNPTLAPPSCNGHWCLPDTDNACAERSLPDGDYQACPSCNHYLSCRSGVTWRARPCPIIGGVLSQWVITSATQGYCHTVSSSCNQCEIKPTVSTFLRRRSCNTGAASGTRCITGSVSSCQSMPDGDYQACERCSIFHSCSGGHTYANRPCPPNPEGGYLKWRSTSPNSGYCDHSSPTCSDCA